MSGQERRLDGAGRGVVEDELLVDLLDALDALDAVEGRAGGLGGGADPDSARGRAATSGEAPGGGGTGSAAMAEDRSIVRARARFAHDDATGLGEELVGVRRRFEETRRRARSAVADSRRHAERSVGDVVEPSVRPAASAPLPVDRTPVERSRDEPVSERDAQGRPEEATAAQTIAAQGTAARLYDGADQDRGMGAQLAAALDHAARQLMPARRGRGTSTADVVDETLALIVAGAIDSVPHTVHAGISMIDRAGVIQSRAPSDPVAAELDALQNSLGEGPCRDAVYDPHPVLAEDLSDVGSRWPRFAAAAHARGVTAVLSFQLFTADDGTTGALNLYAGVGGRFDRSSADIGSLFASQAALALHGARRAFDLNAALATRDVIGQAKGILMERFGIDSTAAFALLVEASQNTNIKLHDVAEWTIQETARTNSPNQAG